MNEEIKEFNLAAGNTLSVSITEVGCKFSISVQNEGERGTWVSKKVWHTFGYNFSISSSFNVEIFNLTTGHRLVAFSFKTAEEMNEFIHFTF